MEENQITIVDEKGNEHLCEIIFTFDAEKFGKKSYVVFSNRRSRRRWRPNL